LDLEAEIEVVTENLPLDLEEEEVSKEVVLMEVKEEISFLILAVTTLEEVLEALEDVKFKFYFIIFFYLFYFQCLLLTNVDRSKFDTAEVGVLNTNPIL